MGPLLWVQLELLVAAAEGDLTVHALVAPRTHSPNASKPPS